MKRSRPARKTVQLGGEIYHTQNEIKTRFEEIRDSQMETLPSSDLAFLCGLAAYHPKLEGCQVVNAVTGKGKDKFGSHNAIWVCFTRGENSETLEWDTISHKSPAQGAMNGMRVATVRYVRACVHDNFRLAIEAQCKTKKASLATDGKIECAACNTRVVLHECDIDHGGGDHLTFTTLMNDFFESEETKEDGFSREAIFGRNAFDIKHPVVARWQVYHQSRAFLQPLCKQCHWKKSGGETSRRRKKE